jgi:AraC-like DNA-binding protein
MDPSCHLTPTVSNEQFIPDHIFIYLESGTMTIYDGSKSYTIQGGDYAFAKRNQLARYSKKGPPDGKFKTVSVVFQQDFLRNFSHEYGYIADGIARKGAIVQLEANPLFENYVQSLMPYLELTGTENENLLFLKKKEIILILLKTNPELKNVLFDFTEPGKIDLEAFMNHHYKFNVSMERFSYLTGRSLTTFKRDFEKIFSQSPGRWLQEKRLQEARFLIEKKGVKASDVYIEVGFEDLSHFSFAFKKMYGVSPNQLKKGG